ncbi:hypothetical protein OUZ56_018678 [Daphnia magna]|uniref:Uncharacterized protein n=1 Tax=Daphnia magna TaxID=35525 RepID=A0ABQ9Z9G6_9CRUS|nr:hypothetical protein OUZ56_018678 [Daphnia magna]
MAASKNFVEHEDGNALVHNEIFETVIECDSDQNIPSQASKISLPLDTRISHVTSECDEEIVNIEDTSLGSNNPLVVPPDTTPIAVFELNKYPSWRRSL